MKPRLEEGADLPLSHASILRTQIALGWVTMLVVAAFDQIFGIVTSVVTESDRRFRSLRMDPGLQGIDILVWFVGIYALMPVYVAIADALRWSILRWIAVVMAALSAVFMAVHYWGHWSAGQRTTVSSNVLDVALNVIGLWVLINSVRWAMLRREPSTIDQPVRQPRARERLDAPAS